MKPNRMNFIYLFLFSLLLNGLTIAQSPALVVEKIEFTGLTKTREYVVRNYLSFSEKQTVTRTQIANDEAALRATHFFKDVQITLSPGSQKGFAVITIAVKERRVPFFQFKSGYNELDGWYLSPLGIRLDNAFGRGNLLGWELLIGDRLNGSTFDYVRPFIWGSEYDFSIALFSVDREFLHFQNQNEFRQNVNDAGLSIKLSGNDGFAKYFSAEVKWQQVIADTFLTTTDENNLHIPLPGYLTTPVDSQNIGRFVLSFRVDTRDIAIHPSKGWWGSITLDQATKELGSYASFYRLTADLRRYQPLWKRLIFAGRLRYGTVSKSAPFFEKYYLGGPNSLRGYADRSLTPPGYAGRIFQGSAELRFPLSKKVAAEKFSGVLFIDTGYAWNTPQSFRTSHLKTGIGYGFRLRLPLVGMVRSDFAYPINSNDHSLRIHISLGHTF